ncbi:plexin-A4 [Rhipicephalus sanguineus]|uniref:Sema domain-containing protein n=1 Tax=Rhipicephalus sanguineus TaxID=34632 RepID=A0A9D4PMR8_RHISA|nr:plexin-A4 [Rhipicephalus sanguineus]KAH7948052.1 hypothetical protein HPB52_018142 [Rhipicephalus sanguineus]
MGRRRNGRQLLAVVLMTLTLDAVLVAVADIQIQTFKSALGPIQNILYLNLSRDDGVVVVSVRNALYALSPDDLSVRAAYKTGPENDSSLCPPYPLSCIHSRNVTDNNNRILLQVGTEPLVLACGSTSQGMCSIHDPLRGLNVTASMDKTLTENYVASKRSTVAFFGNRNDGRHVLFSATVSDGRPPEYRLFPMSSRVLDLSGSFALLSHASAASKYQAVHLVYGFSNNGFAYFVEVRRGRSQSQHPLETWLVRVCEHGESSFRTYVAVPIACRAQNVLLSVATSAHLGPPMYSRGGGGSNTIRILAATFAMSSTVTMSSFKMNLPISAVCFFDMNSVEDAFLSSARLPRPYHEKGLTIRPSYYVSIALG